MINIQNLSSSQLRKVIAIKEKIEALESDLEALIGGGSSNSAATEYAAPAPAKTGRRTMSASAKARIAAAQRARWAKVHAAAGKSEAPAAKEKGKRGRRRMSPAARAKLAAIAKARWAKAKASGKSVL